jgi:excisionase family DNA binding protein
MSDQNSEIDGHHSRSPRRLSKEGLRRGDQIECQKAALQARLRDQKSRERRRNAISDLIEPPSPIGTLVLKPKFVSPREFVELTGVSYATVFRRIRDGTLKSTMFGGRRLIDYGEIEQLRDAAAE